MSRKVPQPTAVANRAAAAADANPLLPALAVLNAKLGALHLVEEKEEEENHHNYISLEHFTGMMEECEVLDVDLSETSLECFRWVQREPENDSQVLRKLPFSDAVLAMSHMCFLVLGDSMPYEESIHLMVDALLELAL